MSVERGGKKNPRQGALTLLRLQGRLLSFPFVCPTTRTSLSFDRLSSAVYTSDVALTDDESSVGKWG